MAVNSKRTIATADSRGEADRSRLQLALPLRSRPSHVDAVASGTRGPSTRRSTSRPRASKTLRLDLGGDRQVEGHGCGGVERVGIVLREREGTRDRRCRIGAHLSGSVRPACSHASESEALRERCRRVDSGTGVRASASDHRASRLPPTSLGSRRRDPRSGVATRPSRSEPRDSPRQPSDSLKACSGRLSLTTNRTSASTSVAVHVEPAERHRRTR